MLPRDLNQRAPGLVYQMLVLMAAGWLQQSDLLIIDYWREENRVLREQLGARRLRLTSEQRRRLAVRAEPLGRSVLARLCEAGDAGDVAGRVPTRGVANGRSDRDQAAAQHAQGCGRRRPCGFDAARFQTWPVLDQLLAGTSHHRRAQLARRPSTTERRASLSCDEREVLPVEVWLN